jgi:DNA mismatch endonuclease (patch repair protein)
MADVVSAEKRSRMMAGIRGKDTKPEVLVRRALFAEGLRFRLHQSKLPGGPDIVLPSKKVAIFVHGCFWHCHAGCRLAKLPASNADFWRKKLDGNVQRDHKAIELLRSAGWRVLTVWECATRDKSIAQSIGVIINKWIDDDEPVGEIAGHRSST